MSSVDSRKKRSTLLVISDAVAATGFSRVVRGILDPLIERYEIHQLALSYFGDPHDWPWKLYPANIGGDPFGVPRVAGLFDKVKPDLVFMVSNFSRIVAYMNALGERAQAVPIVVYSAVESAPIQPEFIPSLREVDRIVFYTEFARRTFEQAVEAQDEEARRDGFALSVIPHGVDTGMFHPMEPGESDRAAVRRRAKKTLFREDQEHMDSFVVLNANRNQRRKRIDVTIRGFAEFARDKDRYVKLHLHMGSPDVGWDVVALARRFGIYDRLILTNEARHLPGVPTEEMNLIYNAADVGLNTASSEGWGLVSFEHAATRAAQVIPRHASLAENWSTCAEMVDPVITLVDPEIRCDQHIVSPEGVAASLERLYDDAHRDSVAEKCYRHATQDDLQWERISGRWARLLGELIG